MSDAAPVPHDQPGDEVDGHRLNDSGAWGPIPGQGRSWQSGDEANGYRLTRKGAWEPIPGQGRPWRAGDEANGFRLYSDGTWKPLDQMSWQERHPKAADWTTPLFWIFLPVGLIVKGVYVAYRGSKQRQSPAAHPWAENR